MGGQCIHDGLLKNSEPQPEARNAAGSAQADAEDGSHFLAAAMTITIPTLNIVRRRSERVVGYSVLKTTMGSVLAARRAGK
jgi:hypothetical protein